MESANSGWAASEDPLLLLFLDLDYGEVKKGLCVGFVDSPKKLQGEDEDQWVHLVDFLPISAPSLSWV